MAKVEFRFYVIFLLLIWIPNDALSLSDAQLRAIMPGCTHPEYLTYINSAMDEGDIGTCPRQAAFLAQIAHESGQLRYMEELASGEEYENRKDLGNIYPGDGKKYKGRGPIQLTGRANYRAAGAALGLDLEADPEQVKTPEVGFRTSVWFWTSRGLNALADQNTLTSFRQITRKINGGTNGQADREMFWNRAKTTLGCTGTTTPTRANPPIHLTTPARTNPPFQSTTSALTDPPSQSTTPALTDPPSQSTTPALTDPPSQSTTPALTDPPSQSTTPALTDPPPVETDPPPVETDPPTFTDPPPVETDPPTFTDPPPVETDPPTFTDPPPVETEPPYYEDGNENENEDYYKRRRRENNLSRKRFVRALLRELFR